MGSKPKAPKVVAPPPPIRASAEDLAREADAQRAANANRQGYASTIQAPLNSLLSEEKDPRNKTLIGQ